MLVLMALSGDEQKAGYDVICGKAPVDFTTGKSSFKEKRAHKYVKRKFYPDYYAEKINEKSRKYKNKATVSSNRRNGCFVLCVLSV